MQLPSLTVEEFDDIGKVHSVDDNDIPVSLQQSQRQEQHKVSTGHMFGCPDALPRLKDIVVEHLSLKVQQKPPVAEVKVRVVPVRVHQVIHLRVQDLNQRPDRHSGWLSVSPLNC